MDKSFKTFGFWQKKSLKSDETRFQNALKRRNCAVVHLQELGQKSHNFFYGCVSAFSVVCAYPFVLGFSPDNLEFQLAVNGAHLHSTRFPELKLLSAKVFWTLERAIINLPKKIYVLWGGGLNSEAS